MAFLTLFWPTDGSFDGGHCPIPDFAPESAHITFGGSGPLVVSDLTGDSREVAICGQHISIFDVGPLDSG
jgi:hypothetical protein